MSHYSLVIIDFDGTLAETLDDVAWCMTRTFEKYGVSPPPKTAVRETMGLPLEEAFHLLNPGKIVPDKMSDWVSSYRHIYRSHGALFTTLFPGAKECLCYFQQKNMSVIVVSNKGIEAIKASLTTLGISEHVALALGADLVSYRKPDPNLYLKEIKPRYRELESSSVLVVGDTATDLKFAQAAGLRSCWASYGYGNRSQCVLLKPDYIIKSLFDLPVMLENS